MWPTNQISFSGLAKGCSVENKREGQKKLKKYFTNFIFRAVKDNMIELFIKSTFN